MSATLGADFAARIDHLTNRPAYHAIIDRLGSEPQGPYASRLRRNAAGQIAQHAAACNVVDGSNADQDLGPEVGHCPQMEEAVDDYFLVMGHIRPTQVTEREQCVEPPTVVL